MNEKMWGARPPYVQKDAHSLPFRSVLLPFRPAERKHADRWVETQRTDLKHAHRRAYTHADLHNHKCIELKCYISMRTFKAGLESSMNEEMWGARPPYVQKDAHSLPFWSVLLPFRPTERKHADRWLETQRTDLKGVYTHTDAHTHTQTFTIIKA